MIRKKIISILFFIFLMGCSSKNHPELLVLENLQGELSRLEGIEHKVWKGRVSAKELEFLGDDTLTLSTDPFVVQKVIDSLYLNLFKRYTRQMMTSELNELTDDQKRIKSLVKARNRQSQLRIDIYKRLILKLYKFDGEEREALNTLIKDYTGETYSNYKQMISELTLSYYKNVPELNGPTLDIEPTFFTVKVDYGYTRGDKKMQTLINANKMQLTDLTRHFFSQLTEEELRAENEFYIKTQLLLAVNRELLQYDKKEKLEGIQDVAIIKLQTFTLR